MSYPSPFAHPSIHRGGMFRRQANVIDAGTAVDQEALATEWKRCRDRRGRTAAVGPVAKMAGTVGRSRKEARLEAVLFVAEGALSARKLAQFATLADHKEARAIVNSLNEAYARTNSSFRIECVAGGYRLLTRPEFAPWLDKLHDRKTEVQLSAPALETLTIVAYRQPVTRADIEAVRGVQSTEILKLLMEKGLVRITGEDDSLGRPYLYGTTNLFLESFGLSSLKDLPLREEFEIQEEPETDEIEADEETGTIETAAPAAEVIAEESVAGRDSADTEDEDQTEEGPTGQVA